MASKRPKVPKLKVVGGRQASALGEARTVVEWAGPTTPEWVRCLGALWEATAAVDPTRAAALEEDFRARLHEMLTTHPNAPAWIRDDPKRWVSRRLDDLEVVVRQLRERWYYDAAAVAAVAGTEVFPGESWVFSVAANCLRQAGDARRALTFDRRCAELLEAAGSDEAAAVWSRLAEASLACADVDADTLAFALRKDGVPDAVAAAIVTPSADRGLDRDVPLALQVARLRRLAAVDPDAALAGGLEWFDATDRHTLAETSEGHALVELVSSELIARNDPRAVHIGQQMVEAKLEQWGECPATWLERQNLGSILAELGRVEEGRALVEAARRALVDEHGEDHPAVAMCDRNLARISARSDRT